MDLYFDLSFVRISTWGCQSLLITSPGKVLFYGAPKMADISEAAAFLRMFCSIRSRLFPLQLRAWIHDGDAAETADKNSESSEGNRRESQWCFWPSCSAARAGRGLITLCIPPPLWGVTTVNLFFFFFKTTSDCTADYIYVIFSHFLSAQWWNDYDRWGQSDLQLRSLWIRCFS